MTTATFQDSTYKIKSKAYIVLRERKNIPSYIRRQIVVIDSFNFLDEFTNIPIKEHRSNFKLTKEDHVHLRKKILQHSVPGV